MVSHDSAATPSGAQEKIETKDRDLPPSGDRKNDALYRFSSDLEEQSRLHVLFLRTIHASGASLTRPSHESFRRYADLWLPLLDFYQRQVRDNGEVSSAGLIPPVDIAWLWHCHRLAPYRYAQHIRERFHVHEPFEAEPPFSLQLLGKDSQDSLELPAAINARNLWKQLYPTEPFFLTEVDCGESPRGDELGVLSGFNVLDSADRQSTFLWQVSGPRFNDPEFLSDGVRNYFRFLMLKGTEEGRTQTIVPTYQIDLMWHTHILNSLEEYNADCMSIIGQTLNHDDSLNDRSENSTLNVAFRATTKLWRTMYGTEYAVSGGMYRGEPPESYFDKRAWQGNGESPTGPYLHLIGIVGASSTPTSIPGASEWTPFDGSRLTPDGKEPFIVANAKSKSLGVNNNPERSDYIFGNGPRGYGYYHTTTRQAYQILLVRIDRRIQSKQSEISCNSCLACMFPCSGALVKKQRLEEEVADLQTLRNLVDARSKADVPVGVVGIPENLTSTDQERFRSNNYYTDGGIWLFPVDLREAGGGCGAVVHGGGGCGGGACGGGACGGGGCGGGGCGGGGCGG